MTPLCLCLFILRMIYHDLKQESLPFIHVWYTLENIYVRGSSKETYSYFYIEKRTFKGMCEVYHRAKRDKK